MLTHLTDWKTKVWWNGQPAVISQQRTDRKAGRGHLWGHGPHSAVSEDTDVAYRPAIAHSRSETLWHKPVVLKAGAPGGQHQDIKWIPCSTPNLLNPETLGQGSAACGHPPPREYE